MDTPTTPQTQEQLKTLAATNDPSLAPDSFEMGGKTFPIIFLKYKQQLVMMSHIQPLLTLVTGAVTTAGELNLTGMNPALLMSAMLEYCGDHLPKLVSLICNATDATITPEWVEEHATSPMQLAGVVMQQVAVNHMIDDLMRFFVRLRPMLAMVMPKLVRPIQPSASTTEETPSS